MDEKQMHDIIAQNINMLLSSDLIPNSSMRNLSTCLGANDSYIQKIMNKTSFPSFKKLIALSNHFEREPWTFLYDTKHNPQRLELLKLINDSPDAMLPIIIETIKMLNNNFITMIRQKCYQDDCIILIAFLRITLYSLIILFYC